MNRRSFLRSSALAASSGILVPPLLRAANEKPKPSPGSVPSYLKDYEKLYAKNPRAAALQWFRDAHFGLFLHYGLYSLLGRGEWVQFRENIHVAEY